MTPILPLYLLVFLSSLSLTAISEKYLIPRLSKNAKQPIYAEGPSWHISKSGTPTMGGLGFLFATCATVLPTVIFLFSREMIDEAYSLLISILFAVSNAAVGIIDDITKLKRKENAGLSPTQKLLVQFLLSVIFLYSRARLLGDTTELYFSFGKIDIGIFYYPIAIIMLLGIINCANLTDGVDGLASSVAFSIGVALFYLSISTNASDVSVISAGMVGAAIGFLIFNVHPAKIFMGDTGSLFFGALTVSCAFSLKNPLLMILLGGVYVIEGVSVILQVISFKLTGKRIFKMAPIHHHLEKCGMSENKICILAMIVTFLLSIPAIMIFGT